MSEMRPARVLARKRAVARVALWFEHLWPAAWPALGVLGVVRHIETASPAGNGGDGTQVGPSAS